MKSLTCQDVSRVLKKALVLKSSLQGAGMGERDANWIEGLLGAHRFPQAHLQVVCVCVNPHCMYTGVCIRAYMCLCFALKERAPVFCLIL